MPPDKQQNSVPASDELMHPLEAAPNFNESMYFNIADPRSRIGGFFRLGNRPNEGHAEMTVALYLPGGRAAFMYRRPEISGNHALAAGGLSFEVARPFEDLVVRYQGEVLILDEPMDMLDPKAAFTNSPREVCEIEIRYADVAPAWGGELEARDESDTALADFWKGHYEAHSHGVGTIRIGEQSWEVDGWGLRDHSWGPRTWQSISWYRWLCGNFERDGLVLSLIGIPTGPVRVGGALLIAGEYHPAREIELDTDWDGDDLPSALRMKVTTECGVHEISGAILNTIPLRHRLQTEDGLRVSRIGEGYTEWSWNGRTGYGLSEYLDRIEDGRPAGLLTSVSG
ncbi:MAG: hypothetical protein U0R71_11075 [Solirubrobacterales bacterium]